jgi:predicted nucleic acid-binding protein
VDEWDALVTDTGPLISLEVLPDGFAWIRRHLQILFIPPAVLEEFAFPYGGPERCLSETGLKQVSVVRRPRADALRRLRSYEMLDQGERHAIALAKEVQAPLLIEERAGRRVAQAVGVESTGIAGLIDRARQQGALSFSEARERWQILLDEHRIPEKLYRALVQPE